MFSFLTQNTLFKLKRQQGGQGSALPPFVLHVPVPPPLENLANKLNIIKELKCAEEKKEKKLTKFDSESLSNEILTWKMA